ncbi:DUF6270 domain-containing protein [Actinotalea sp. AC32]|nr:DUF6270 domain-containing protein [Actinotalea sp. AC32]
MTGAPLSVLIYGSCVSRDSFELFDPERYELMGYHARHSLISAFSRAPEDVVERVRLDSPFQRRMVRQDARSGLVRALYRRTRPDVVLWDLVDERLGVIELPDGGHLTLSNELIASGVALPEGHRHIPFGTDEHFDLWSTALGAFSRLLSSRGLRRRTVLLVTPWAEVLDSGEPAPTSHGVTSAQANASFDRYHAAAAAVPDVRTLRMEQAEAVGSTEHRWGPAPFHYTDAFYRTVAARFDELTRPA